MLPDLLDVSVPEGAIETAGVEFAEVARQRGLLHVWPQQPRPMRLPDTFGCGCAAFDYDNDGWQDVLLVADPHPVLYRKTGGGYFENVTARSGLVSAQVDSTADLAGAAVGKRARRIARLRARSGGWVDWTGVAVGDYDADGWLDLILTGYHRLALFKNRGGEKFIDVTAQAGLDGGNHGHWASSAGFMDLDGDRRLDLVVLNYVEFGPPLAAVLRARAGGALLLPAARIRSGKERNLAKHGPRLRACARIGRDGRYRRQGAGDRVHRPRRRQPARFLHRQRRHARRVHAQPE